DTQAGVDISNDQPSQAWPLTRGASSTSVGNPSIPDNNSHCSSLSSATAADISAASTNLLQPAASANDISIYCSVSDSTPAPSLGNRTPHALDVSVPTTRAHGEYVVDYSPTSLPPRGQFNTCGHDPVPGRSDIDTSASEIISSYSL